ncbi:MAG: alpha/beta hydrolase [Burkholderiales bacterium]|nr:alpha/beta hydrolase [Burkholderiales bacterium]
MVALALTVVIVLIVLLFGIGAAVALIAVLIAASFLIAAAHASPRPPESRLDAAAALRLWLGELLAAIGVMLILLPLERWLMRRDVSGRRDDVPPVLLIHGYVNNAGALFILWRALKQAGVAVHTLNLEPVYGDIDGYCEAIEQRLAAIQARNGGARVALVCHSMGGLAARAYLRRHGGARVAQVVTLGTPHAGTVLAYGALGVNGRQMRPGSAWLAALARDEGGAWPCPLVSIYSHDDNIVAPQDAARLAGARNVAVAGIGHIALPMSARVARLVLAELGVPAAGSRGG